MELLLKDFRPVSELVVPAHPTPRAKFHAIDFHTHYCRPFRPTPGNMDEVFAEHDAANVVGCVNLVGADGAELDAALELERRFERRMVTFAGLDFARFAQPGFEEYAKSSIEESIRRGCVGLKFFKELGLTYKDADGSFIAPNDPRLSVIWKTAADLGVPVLYHIADPKAFFKPVNASNERYSQLMGRPEWSFYGGGRYTFEQLLDMQADLLQKNPDTTFIIPHVGSAPEDLGLVSRMMDACPNLSVDFAARLAELGRQPRAAREFIMKYADRFLFATDNMGGGRAYPGYFRFLETWDECFEYPGWPNNGFFFTYGIALPDDVLKKIYYENAVRLVPSLKKCIK